MTPRKRATDETDHSSPSKQPFKVARVDLVEQQSNFKPKRRILPKPSPPPPAPPTPHVTLPPTATTLGGLSGLLLDITSSSSPKIKTKPVITNTESSITVIDTGEADDDDHLDRYVTSSGKELTVNKARITSQTRSKWSPKS